MGDAVDTNGAHKTPDQLRNAPGFLARRLNQAFTAAWVRRVDGVLTGPQYAVLTAVRTHPEVDQGSLAACVALDRSTMADVCRRLEDRGLIRRDTAPGDGRRKLLLLTEAGTEMLTRIEARVEDLNLELLDDDPEPGGLIDRLDRLADRWEALAAPVAENDDTGNGDPGNGRR